MQTSDYYILISTATPSLAQIKSDCAAKHMQATQSKTQPAQRAGIDGLQVLIKVRDGDQTWVNSKPWKGEVLVLLNNGKQAEDDIRQAWALADDKLFNQPK